MPSSREILHTRTLQCPGRPSAPVNMESVRNYVLSRKQSHKAQFDRAHGTCVVQELGPGQEVLFRSPSNDEYIPQTVVNKATMLHSYIIEALGKHYHRTREHLRPIHINLPAPKLTSNNPPTPSHFHPASLNQCLTPNSLAKPNSQLQPLHHIYPAALPRPKQPSKPTLVLMLPQQSMTCFDTYPS